METTELMSADLVRLAFVLGMVLSVFLYEKSHLTTGSIVVPGFLAIHLFDPMVIIGSILNAGFCYLLVHKAGPQLILVCAKTKFQLLIITSVLLQIAWNHLTSLQLPLAHAGDAMAGFGCVIPGLIAHDMARNGPIKTALNTLFISYVVGAVVFLLLVTTPSSTLSSRGFEAPPGNFDLILVLTLSIIGSLLLKSRTSIRSGGYVTAAYIVFFVYSPATLATIFAAALVTYLICCNCLMPSMIIFGRRKFALMLLVGSILTWSVLLLLSTLGMEIPFASHSSYAGIMILLPGLIANDVERHGIFPVTSGLLLLSTATFLLARLIYEINTFARPAKVLMLVCCLVGAALVLHLVSQRANVSRQSKSILIHEGMIQ